MASSRQRSENIKKKLYYLIAIFMILATAGLTFGDADAIFVNYYPSGYIYVFLDLIPVGGFDLLGTTSGFESGQNIGNSQEINTNFQSPDSLPKNKLDTYRRRGGGGSRNSDSDNNNNPSEDGNIIININADCNASVVTFTIETEYDFSYSLYNKDGELLYTEDDIPAEPYAVEFSYEDVSGASIVVDDGYGTRTAQVPDIETCNGDEGDEMTFDIEFGDDCSNIFAIVVSSFPGMLKHYSADGSLLGTFGFTAGTFQKEFLRTDAVGTHFEVENSNGESLTGSAPLSSFQMCEDEIYGNMCDENQCTDVLCSTDGSILSGCNLEEDRCYTQTDCGTQTSCDANNCQDVSCNDGRTLVGCKDANSCYEDDDCGTSNQCEADADCATVVCPNGVLLQSCVSGICPDMDGCSTAMCNADNDCISMSCVDGTYEQGRCNDLTGVCYEHTQACIGTMDCSPRTFAGDVNGNGRVDIIDAFLLAKIAVGLIPMTCSDDCIYDSDKNGAQGTVLDSMYAAQVAAGLRPALKCDVSLTTAKKACDGGVPGDIISDGAYTIADLYRFDKLWTDTLSCGSETFSCLDVNGDGKISNDDRSLLSTWIRCSNPTSDDVQFCSMILLLPMVYENPSQCSSGITLSEESSCDGSYELSIYSDSPGVLYLGDERVASFPSGYSSIEFAWNMINGDFYAMSGNGEITFTPSRFKDSCSDVVVSSCLYTDPFCKVLCIANPSLVTTPSLITTAATTDLKSSSVSSTECIPFGSPNEKVRVTCVGDNTCIWKLPSGAIAGSLNPSKSTDVNALESLYLNSGALSSKAGWVGTSENVIMQGGGVTTVSIVKKNENAISKVANDIKENKFEVPNYVCKDNKCVVLGENDVATKEISNILKSKTNVAKNYEMALNNLFVEESKPVFEKKISSNALVTKTAESLQVNVVKKETTSGEVTKESTTNSNTATATTTPTKYSISTNTAK